MRKVIGIIFIFLGTVCAIAQIIGFIDKINHNEVKSIDPQASIGGLIIFSLIPIGFGITLISRHNKMKNKRIST